MGDFQEIYNLIKRGEDQQLDFKQHITNSAKIAKTIVAFANTEGGEIVIGINDQGNIKGVDVSQEKYMMIKAGKRFCNPPIYIYFRTLHAKEGDVLIAEIKKSKSAEHRALNEAGDWLHYVRVNDQTVLVEDIEGQNAADKYNLKPIPILEEHKGLVNFLEANDSISIKEYMKMMNISYTVAKRSLDSLVATGVLHTEYISNVPYYFLSNADEKV